MENNKPEPAASPVVSEPTFQTRTKEWTLACFGPEITMDKVERNHRSLEENLELVQSLGCTASEAHQLVDYVFSRPVGDPQQELGGVMVTLAALANANELDMQQCAETELTRVWSKIEKIRAKQAGKPKHSPLPASPEGKIDAGEAQAEKIAHTLWYRGGRMRNELRDALVMHPENWHKEGLEQMLAQWDEVATTYASKILLRAQPTHPAKEPGK